MKAEQLAVWICILCTAALFSSCGSTQEDSAGLNRPQPIFRDLPVERTGIQFSNVLEHTERLNTYTYRNFYNGAGVAAGDINNDGLVDLYFAGNQVNNRLYLNKGDFRFEDITESSGLACENVWSTGVSMADVNGDGWLDIYVCKSGPPDTPNRNNELFINNGDLTFTERSQEYGIDDRGLSNHAAFFDYDRDGDLDMYLLNNSLRSIGIYDLREGQREIRDPEGGNKLYRNDGEHFSDVSEEAGIYGSAIGFGLGVTIADVNKDFWPDIFVSNDFFERDYLYINNGDGTFTERLTDYMNEISMGSMGADIADLNNDTYPEIYVSEMLPASLERVKTKTLFEDWDKYQSDVNQGYHHQFTRNALQVNNGPVPGDESNVSFSEISRLTGTEATDWSWGALLFDVNNDGWRDIFVANGIFKDLTDQDYVNFYSNNEILIARHKKDSTLLTTLIDKIPSVPLSNFLFINKGNLDFTDGSQGSGLDFKGFSNGTAYADLDNDGDLDLVLNNINDPVKIYENLSAGNNYLQLELKGYGRNTNAIGAFVYAYSGETTLTAQHFPVKGYMSSMDPRVHLGLGTVSKLDSLLIIWPDGNQTRLHDLPVNQSLAVNYSESSPSDLISRKSHVSSWLERNVSSNLDTVHHSENDFNDFDRDRLLYEMYSNEGPGAASGDLNGDDKDDFILGGSRGFPLRVFIQENDGFFRQFSSPVFDEDHEREDVELELLDADNDGDLDIFAASGSNEFPYLDFRLKDRLYLNNGDGTFQRSVSFSSLNLPAEPTGFVLCFDFDNDGDTDILTGTRSIPFKYGDPGGIHVYVNKGNGNFEMTDPVADLAEIGMLTDAAVADFDGDGADEVILAGEWMVPICIEWNGENFVRKDLFSLPSGLYKSVHVADINNDGKADLIFGNNGTNSRLRASIDRPLIWHISDYDQNGRPDHILSMYEGDTLYPVILLQDLAKQLPVMRKRFQTFGEYRNASTREVLSGLHKTGEQVLTCETLESFVWINGNPGYSALPWSAQLSPVYAMFTADIDKKEGQELVLAGNQKRVKPELGSYNASFGAVLKWQDGEFKAMPFTESGFWIRGEVRGLLPVNIDGRMNIMAVRNSDNIEIFSVKE